MEERFVAGSQSQGLVHLEGHGKLVPAESRLI